MAAGNASADAHPAGSVPRPAETAQGHGATGADASAARAEPEWLRAANARLGEASAPGINASASVYQPTVMGTAASDVDDGAVSAIGKASAGRLRPDVFPTMNASAPDEATLSNTQGAPVSLPQLSLTAAGNAQEANVSSANESKLVHDANASAMMREPHSLGGNGSVTGNLAVYPAKLRRHSHRPQEGNS